MIAIVQDATIDKRMGEENNPVSAANINLDIIYVILTLLPVRTLLRFRSVCKSWYDLISDLRFVNAHIERSRRNPKVAISSYNHHENRNIPLNFYEEGKYCPDLFMKRFTSHSILGNYRVHPVHCDGLLLLETSDKTLVCNPSTKEIATLPEGNQPLFNGLKVICGNAKTSFGFVSGANVYKVARYFFRDYDFKDIRASTSGFEVFRLGIDSSWRVTSMDPPKQIHMCEDYPVSAGGAIYYKINYESGFSPDFQLFRFDLTCEEFTDIPTPPSLKRTDYPGFGELEGTLCLFVVRSTEKFDVLKLLKDSTGYTWIQAFSVHVPSRPCFFWPYVFRPVQMRRGKLILQIRNRLVFYDLRTKYIDNIDFGTGQDFASHYSFHAVSYVESLVSFGGTRAESN